MDYLICKICGSKCKRIYGNHLKKHNITSKEYLDMFPNEKLAIDDDLKATSKNSGKHMKNDYYKKLFSAKLKNNNPNRKDITTEQERKSRSPFCLEFYSGENPQKQHNEFLKSFNIIQNTKLEYYLNKGYNLSESEKLLNERQSTFSLKKCIDKYGYNDGIEVFNKRQEKWKNSLIKNGNLKNGYSKISQELFNILDCFYEKSNNYFHSKNGEYFIHDAGRLFLYDFVDFDNKKIIEYNGDVFHANPNMFKFDEHPNPFNTKLTSDDIWNYDMEKYYIAIKNGFDVLIIWDSEYLDDKIKIILKCLNFLF